MIKHQSQVLSSVITLPERHRNTVLSWLPFTSANCFKQKALSYLCAVKLITKFKFLLQKNVVLA